MRNLSILITALALSGCMATGPSLKERNASTALGVARVTSEYYQEHGEAATLKAGKDAVKSMLKDPESAQFTSVRMGEFRGEKIVCGNVNAQNSFGGYVGVKPFAAGPLVAIIYEEYDYDVLTNAANVAINEGCAR